MKTLFLACALIVCAGCATPTVSTTTQTVLGQRILDKYLSPGFTGDLDFHENIPLYLSLSIKGSNLRREENGWKYDWIEYTRNGPFGTSARLIVGKRP